jgi:hypothetical protein
LVILTDRSAEIQTDDILNPFSIPNSENLNSVPLHKAYFVFKKKYINLIKQLQIVFEILRILRFHTMKLRTCRLSQSTVHAATRRHIPPTPYRVLAAMNTVNFTLHILTFFGHACMVQNLIEL